MIKFIQISQIVLSIVLILSIILQNRGTGLGGAFGGEANVYRSKRGIEKFLFWTSFVTACLFVGISIFNLIYLSK
jgi:protein translocase SecG subunit